jgi:flavin reductase (DIM6/NTAB) family NADH-FMN oxidoreductase RutF
VTQEPSGSIAPGDFRTALGRFASGITIMSTLQGGVAHAMTANAFTSVSLDPPLLLVCLYKGAASATALVKATHFAINVLQTGQQPASITFSTRVEDRFGQMPWSCGENGAPILKDSMGVFECENYAVYDGGDHHILVGQVVKASFDASLDPLLYFRGSYRRLHFD